MKVTIQNIVFGHSKTECHAELVSASFLQRDFGTSPE